MRTRGMTPRNRRPSSGRWSSWVVFFGCIAGIAAAGYVLWPRQPPDLLVLGDSVTFQASPAIERRLSTRFHLQVDAYPFYRSTDLEGILRKIMIRRRSVGRPLDSAVFLVGYNDVLNDQVAASALPRMMRDSEAFDCAVWLTLPATPGGRRAASPGFAPARVEAWNARLHRLAGGKRHLHISPAWAELVNAPGGEKLLQADGIHPAEEGRVTLAAAIEIAIEDSCR